MESPLEVLSRAATMVQDNANEARLTTKELPTTKWRRERRLRATAVDYHHTSTSLSSSPSSSSTPPSSPHHHLHHHNHHHHLMSHNNIVKPLNETTNTASNMMMISAIAAAVASETPIDMSVTSTTMKPRSPPPPYREPLPGSTFATLSRPSVITQAPPKRENCNSRLISNRENDNRSTESISMCDPVIDEHFRRSLGADYMALFSKKSPSSPNYSNHEQLQQQDDLPEQQKHSSQFLQLQQPQQQDIDIQQKIEHPKPAISPKIMPKTTITVTTSSESSSIASSVDDHFAKALGDTWKKLQADKELSKNENTDSSRRRTQSSALQAFSSSSSTSSLSPTTSVSTSRREIDSETEAEE